ncbi:MAG: hypothetical protein ABIS01_11555 [Ferruginibacter sp.]
MEATINANAAFNNDIVMTAPSLFFFAMGIFDKKSIVQQTGSDNSQFKSS